MIITNKIDNFSTNRYLRANNGLPGAVDVDDISPESEINKYVDME